MKETKNALKDEEIEKVVGGAKYDSLEKDDCFEKSESERVVLVYDYPSIDFRTNFIADVYKNRAGSWILLAEKEFYPQSDIFKYKYIGKWRP